MYISIKLNHGHLADAVKMKQLKECISYQDSLLDISVPHTDSEE